MDFVRSKDVSEGQAKLISELTKHLSEGSVLWLLTGGQNIPIEVTAMYFLDDSLTSNLYMLLSDERYGPKGYKDSNYAALMERGMNIKNATFPDILENGPSPEAARQLYKQTYEDFKSQVKFTIAQFGIGDDGHIAGVLPHTEGVNSTDTALYYESQPYKRLTLTLNALKSIDETFVYCFGDQKKQALTRLKEGQESLDSLPSLILRDMNSVTVYNDQL